MNKTTCHKILKRYLELKKEPKLYGRNGYHVDVMQGIDSVDKRKEEKAEELEKLKEKLFQCLDVLDKQDLIILEEAGGGLGIKAGKKLREKFLKI